MITVAVLMCSVYYYIYTLVKAGKDKSKVIWVPPKAKPSLPFGLGPEPEPLKDSDFVKTTYEEYETKLIKEAGQALLMPVGISMFMSLKFNVHVSLLMQVSAKNLHHYIIF